MSFGRSRRLGIRTETTFSRKYRSWRKVWRATSCSKVAVGRRNDPNIQPHRSTAANAVDLPLLDGSQQLGLQAAVHLTDFIE